MTSVGQAVTAEIASAAAPASWLARVVGLVAVGLALLSAVATFVVLANLTPILPTHEVVLALLLFNGFTILILLAVIARELWRMLQARRHGRAGSRLHIRIVTLFSVIAAVPAILVAVVASVTVDRGLDRLFSSSRSFIENSLEIAAAYELEHKFTLRAHALTTAFELD